MRTTTSTTGRAVPAIRTIGVTLEDHDAAVQALLAASRRDLSLVDCTSFLVMRRLGLRNAFTFDADFEAQGFGTVPAGAG